MRSKLLRPFDQSNTLKYSYYGALFGLCFPIIATLIWAYDHNCSLIEAQTTYGHPLLWIIDTAPFFLGLFSSFAGKRQDEIEGELNIEKEKQLHSAKLAALGEMSSGLAHELKNPLFVISGFIQVIDRLSSKNELTHDKLKDLLLPIVNTVDRMNKIINGLSRYSRHSEDESFTEITISALYSQTLDFANIKLKEKQVSFELVLDQEITISCKSVQISQVILNLINNSIDAIEDLSKRWIRVYTYFAGDNIIIHHTDSGTGIAPEIVEQLFLPFFTTKDVDKGTGLGLSISTKIINAHRGELIYEEKDNHTGFKITLPKYLN